MLGSPQKLVQNSPEAVGFWLGLCERGSSPPCLWEPGNTSRTSIAQTGSAFDLECLAGYFKIKETRHPRPEDEWFIPMRSPSQSFPILTSLNQDLFAYWPLLMDDLVPSVHCLPTHSLGNRPKYWQGTALPVKVKSSRVGPHWGNLPGKTEYRKGKSFSAKISHQRKMPFFS